MPALVWEEFLFNDPDGGKIIFWPHIPCIRMPVKLRSHSNFHGVAFLTSSMDLQSWIMEDKQEKESPGVHRDSAIASGTVLGRLMTDLNELELDGPVIPILNNYAYFYMLRIQEEDYLFMQLNPTLKMKIGLIGR